MRKTALILIMLTLYGISANVLAQEDQSQEGGQVIDLIVNESQIVISDAVYQIDPYAAFFAVDGKTLLEFSAFRKGDAVEFTLNSRGEIIELIKSAGQ